MNIAKPLSKEESKTGDIVPAGIYPFEVLSAKDDVSKSGNYMIVVKLKLFMPDGRERIFTDYLTEKLPYKLAHFFDCIGKWEVYEAGEVYAEHCEGGLGEVKIYVKKDTTGGGTDQSAVADYLLSDAQQTAKQDRKAAAAQGRSSDGFEDEKIPF